MGKVKRKILNFLPCEKEALEKYLEKLALEGWKLEGVTGRIFKFRKIEPQKIKYSIAVIDSIKFLDGADSDDSLEYREYCKMAGWDFVCGADKIQIFSAEENVETIDMHTDSEIEKNILFKSSLKYLGLELITLMAVLINMVNIVGSNNGDFLASNLSLGFIALAIGWIIGEVDSIFVLIRWKKNGFVRDYKKVKMKNLIYGTYGWSIIAFIVYDLIFINTVGGYAPLVAGVMVIGFSFIVEKIRNGKRKNKKMKIFVACVLGVFFMTSSIVTLSFSYIDREEREASIKIADLGDKKKVDENDFVISEKSLLANHERNLIEGEKIDLNYNIFKSDYKWVIDYKLNCVEDKIKEYPDRYTFKEVENLEKAKIYENTNGKEEYYIIGKNKVVELSFYRSEINKLDVVKKIYNKLFA